MHASVKTIFFLGPIPEFDPDIVAQLDSDDETCDPEDEKGFPDNFVSLLNAEGNVEGEDSQQDQFRDIEQWLLGTSQLNAEPSFNYRLDDKERYKHDDANILSLK